MQNIKNIFVGFLVSFIGSIPLGYLNVVGFDIYAQKGMQSTIWYLLGVICIEFIVIFFTLIFAKKLAENIQLNDPIKTLREGISMNIGMYSLQTLIENSNSLDKLKYYPKTKEDLQQVKNVFVVNEDIIFKIYHDYCYKNNYIGVDSDTMTITMLKDRFKKDVYQDYFNALENSTIQRQMGYSYLLDLYKFQANWQWGNGWKIGI
jgi:hypothetical protein